MAWKPAYVTKTQLKSYLRITDSADDDQLDFAIEAASRAIDLSCNRQFGLIEEEVRYYSAEWDKTQGLYVVEMDDVPAATGITEVMSDNDNDFTFDHEITEYRLWPFNAEANGKPYTRLFVNRDSDVKPVRTVGGIKITSDWGWSTVPEVVEQACLLQASRFFSRRNSPYGIAGSPELGNELRLLAKVDPDVQLILGSVKRQWGVIR